MKKATTGKKCSAKGKKRRSDEQNETPALHNLTLKNSKEEILDLLNRVMIENVDLKKKVQELEEEVCGYRANIDTAHNPGVYSSLVDRMRHSVELSEEKGMNDDYFDGSFSESVNMAKQERSDDECSYDEDITLDIGERYDDGGHVMEGVSIEEAPQEPVVKDKEGSPCSSSQSEKTFNCPLCSKVFKRGSHLKRHVLVHNDSPCHCSHCGKDFPSHQTLKKHMENHTDERKFKCEKCEKSYKLKKHLRRHEISHRSQKPHVCLGCNRQFTRLEHLRYHMERHGDHQHHPCTICGRIFKLAGALEKHMKTHVSGYCGVCGERFKDNNEVKRHMAEEHADAVELE